jgi:aldose 1-epimerase
MSMKASRRRLALGALILTSSALVFTQQKEGAPEVKQSFFGKTTEGDTVSLYTLRNANGLEARITNYGGALVSLMVPDREGQFDDVVLGYDSLAGYLTNKPYFGALVGRYANRIARGQFTLEGTTYALARNDGENHLHGGIKGLTHTLWHAAALVKQEGPALQLSYTSPDGEDGYPGALAVTVVYTLTNKNEFVIDYTATSDKPTIINLTHHSYFNLAGAGMGSILMHDLEIDASRFTPVGKDLIPTGELRSVEDTPMDFRRLSTIGFGINSPDEQIMWGKGFDHNWVLDKNEGELALAARLYEGRSGRLMEVYTTEPGIQFYSGNFLDGSEIGKGGTPYRRRYGLCLETQHFPDSPNHSEFPSTVLRPAETFRSRTSYRFLVR